MSRCILAIMSALLAVFPVVAFAGWDNLVGKTVIAEFDHALVNDSPDFGHSEEHCLVTVRAYVSSQSNLFYSEVKSSCDIAPTSLGDASTGLVIDLDKTTTKIDGVSYKVTETRFGFRIDSTERSSVSTKKGLIEVSVSREGGCSLGRHVTGNVSTMKLSSTYALRSCRIVDGKQ